MSTRLGTDGYTCRRDRSIARLLRHVAANSCHSPGTPFRTWLPRSAKQIPDPATRSFTVFHTSTSPGPARLETREGMWTAIPASRSPLISTSPVCRPARTSRPIPWTDSVIVVAQRIPRAGRRTWRGFRLRSFPRPRRRTSRRRLPPACVLARAAPGFSRRGQGSRRLAALLSPAQGHRPSRALAFRPPGAPSWRATGGKGGEVGALRKGFWNS